VAFDDTLTGLAAEIQLATPRQFVLFPGERLPIRVNARNTGAVTWHDPAIFRAAGRVYRFRSDGARQLLPDEWRLDFDLDRHGPVVPGAGYSFSGRLAAPAEPGEYVLTVGLVAEDLGWLATLPVEILLTVRAPE
jgi:hypothetical protein